MSKRDTKIFLTGAKGFLGQHLYKELLASGFTKKNIYSPSPTECDLRLFKNCLKATVGQEIVIHAAGNIGGIGKNQAFPGLLMYDNLIMGINIIEACRINKVKKLIIIGTVCEYPKYTPIPFHESDLWLGYPENTNAPYGIAKKTLLVMGQAYSNQYGLNIVHLLPTNMYGPGDHFDEKTAHVIPDLIRKIHAAKKSKAQTVTLWGDGSPTREFIYVTDTAKAIVKAANLYNSLEPLNIGSGFEISIKDLASLIAQKLKWTGEFIWDTSRPNGQPRRLIDSSKAQQALHWKTNVKFSTGLDQTIKYYLKHHK